MSFKDGMAALNLEMPDRVPRTEYSAECHWDLVRAVTGLPVTFESTAELKETARKAFVKAWNYDLAWSILINDEQFGDKRTRMGHAAYASGGTDLNYNVVQLFDDPNDVLSMDPWELYGQRDQKELIRNFEQHYKNNCVANPDLVNMTGIYISLLSGLIDILGWESLLLAAGMDERGFGEVVNRYASWISQFFEALANSDVPVVMIHDDIVWTEGAIFHPDWYRTYIFPNYKKLFAPIVESGKKLIFTSDGNYTEFIDDIAECGINGFVLEPLTDMRYIAEKYGKTHAFIGNADTRVLLRGTKEEIYAEVKRCMDIGKKCPGFIMAVGNHIPSNTPVDNALYYNEAYELLSRR